MRIWAVISAALASITIPLLPQALQAQTVAEVLELPGQPADRIVKLPVGSTVVKEEIGCNRDALKRARKRFKIRFKCYASINFDGATYLVAENWLRGEDYPGPYQVLLLDKNDGRILGDMSAVTGGFMVATQNSGNLEYLSVSLAEPYNKNTGWPYLRYVVSSKGVELLPTRMFTAATNPVTISRATFVEGAARAEAAKNDIMLQACASVGELARGLDQVVNEMQIYNYSIDIWRQSRGCNFRNGREIKPENSKFIGWYLSEPQRGKPRFWSLIFAVEFEPRKEAKQLLPGVTISEETRLFVSYRIYRETMLDLPAPCRRTFVQRPERYKTIRLYGVGGEGILPMCDFVP